MCYGYLPPILLPQAKRVSPNTALLRLKLTPNVWKIQYKTVSDNKDEVKTLAMRQISISDY